jgi:hypothetical protein
MQTATEIRTNKSSNICHPFSYPQSLDKIHRTAAGEN